MDERPHYIAQDLNNIARTRDAIADKLGLIGQCLTSTVEDAKTKVDEIVDRTQATFDDALESAKSATDPARLAQNHPWLLMSGALAVGFALGSVFSASGQAEEIRLSSRSRTKPTGSLAGTRDHQQPRAGRDSYALQNVGARRESRSSFMSEVGTILSNELSPLKENLIAIGSTVLRDLLRETIRAASSSVIESGRYRSRNVREQSPSDSLSH